jgi:hypothetical protein
MISLDAVQDSDAPKVRTEQSDVQTIDGIVRALYESVSFVSGAQPDYTRLRSLFHPSGRLVPPKGERDHRTRVMDVDEFIARSKELVVIGGLERRGFSETEIARRTLSFGNIVHLFSTYESRYARTDPTPIQRGINSIQLLKDQHRWWIVSIVWETERTGQPIPRAYLV